MVVFFIDNLRYSNSRNTTGENNRNRFASSIISIGINYRYSSMDISRTDIKADQVQKGIDFLEALP
jgi:hypothetical protein